MVTVFISPVSSFTLAEPQKDVLFMTFSASASRWRFCRSEESVTLRWAPHGFI